MSRDLCTLEVVVSDRIRTLVWIEKLWDSRKSSPEGLEDNDFIWRGPDPSKIFIGVLLPYDVHSFLFRDDFLDWEAHPHLRNNINVWDCLLGPCVMGFV